MRILITRTSILIPCNPNRWGYGQGELVTNLTYGMHQVAEEIKGRYA